MRVVDLYTHGAGEGLYYVLNAMASLFSGDRGSFIGNLMALSGMVAALGLAWKLVKDFNAGEPINWFMYYMFILILATTVKVEVKIVDRITGYRTVVSGVPWIFGMPAGYFSQVGDLMARKFDQAFRVPDPRPLGPSRTFKDVTSYEKNGVAMTSRLVDSATNFTFISNDMATNMRNFVKECVYFDLALNRYTTEDLTNSENIWDLISKNADPEGGVIYRTRTVDGIQTELLGCQAAADKLTAAWEKELRDAKSFYGRRMYPHARTSAQKDPGKLLEENLVGAYDYLTGISRSSDQIMQQIIMRNAVEDGMLAKAQEDNVMSSIQSYAVAKAEALQEATYSIQGGVAKKAVAVMRIVAELIFMAMFPIVIIISVFPGMLSILKTYFIGLMWLQTWAPLYSVINMIVNIYSKADATTAAITTEGVALTYNTIPSLGASSSSVANMAGYAMMSVPFLSWGILKFGGGAFSQLSAHLGAPINSNSGVAANEVTTGNIQQGALTLGTENRDNITRFQFNENPNISSGMQRIQSGTGSTITTTSHGDTYLDQMPGMSRLGVGFSGRQEISSAYNQMSSESLAAAKVASNGYQESMHSAYDMIKDYRSNRSNQTSSDTSVGSDFATSSNQGFQKLDEVLDSYVEKHGGDRRTAFEKLSATEVGGSMRGGVETSAGINFFGNGASAKLSAETHTGKHDRWSDTNSHSQHSSDETSSQASEQSRFNDAMDEINKYFSSDVVRDSDAESKALGDGISNKLNDAKNYRRDMQANLNKSKQYSDTATMVENSAVNTTEDLSNDFISWASTRENRDGSFMSINDIDAAMKDPAQRTKLREDYLRSHEYLVRDQFNAQAPASKESVKGFHESNVGSIPGESDIRKEFKQNNEKINDRAESANLNNPVDTSHKEFAKKQMESNSKSIEQSKKDVKSMSDSRKKESNLPKQAEKGGDNE